MSTITTQDGTQIYYKDWAEGQPVLFSHGWPLSADAWESQMMYEERAGRAGGLHGPVWWLIVRDESDLQEPLTISCGGEKALPVFSFEEEAEMFHRLAGLSSRWRVRLCGCGELVSVLYGPCSGVGAVALDPLPEMVAEGTVELVSLNRSRFVNRLVRLGRAG